jgi:hypothetical protein
MSSGTWTNPFYGYRRMCKRDRDWVSNHFDDKYSPCLATREKAGVKFSKNPDTVKRLLAKGYEVKVISHDKEAMKKAEKEVDKVLASMGL